jgi:hypothetical protein
VKLALAVLALAADGVLARGWRREAMPLLAVRRMASVALAAMPRLAVVTVEDDARVLVPWTRVRRHHPALPPTFVRVRHTRT